MSSSSQSKIKFTGRKLILDANFVLLNVLTCGIFYFLTKLKTSFRIYLTTNPALLSDADCVVLEDQYGGIHFINVEIIPVKNTLALSRYIKNQSVKVLDTSYGRFIYDYKIDKYVLPNHENKLSKKTFGEIIQTSILRSRDEEKTEIYEKTIIFGKNTMGIKIPKISEIFWNQIMSPLFIWEVLSVIIWISILYYTYCAIVGTIFVIMFILDIYQALCNRRELINNHRITNVKVLRESAFRVMPETEILPGDLIYIETTDSFTCDLEILKGDVISDESFLTGESVPVCKGVGSIVYSGTKIIRSTQSSVSLANIQLEKLVKVKNLIRKDNLISIEGFSTTTPNDLQNTAIGIVIKTGRRTKRGVLFKNLAIKRPSSNEFKDQSSKVIQCLVLGSILLAAVLISFYMTKGFKFSRACRFGFDLGLAFFNPSLYTSLELGSQYSRILLNAQKINVSDVTRINTAGEVDLVVFDKTGTLTELGVDIHCYDTFDKSCETVEELDKLSRVALSTCHHVLELDNQYSGDVLDMKMFLFSKSKIINKDNKRFIEIEVENKYEPICKEYSEHTGGVTLFFNSETNTTGEGDICPEDTFEVLKIYEFDLFLKRLSVIVRNHKGQMFMFSKGAPDSLSKILNDVPKSYVEESRKYGLQGYRVLTVAYKEITEFTGLRETDEKYLKFLGFLIFANKLKEETEDVIKELSEANLSPKMCTGDNILTAISVAKECGMINRSTPVLFPILEEGCKTHYDVEWFCIADEDYVFDKLKLQLYNEFDASPTADFVVAIEGKEFEFFRNSNFYNFILEKCVVYARFNPDNKKELIEEFSDNGFVTMFVGDGANDTGALCSADVGVSLALNEASLAAPFNSVKLDSVLHIIREGKSALSFSAAQFKYVLYTQILIGFAFFACLIFLYFPPDRISLINDLISCYVLGYALSKFKAATKICAKKIQVNLLKESCYILLENCFVFVALFVSSYIVSKSESKLKSTTDINVDDPVKTTSVVFISVISLLVVKSLKAANFGPYRQSRFSNFNFLLILILCLLFCGTVCGLIFTGNGFITEFLNVVPLGMDEKKVAAVCLSICLVFNYIFSNYY